VTVLGASHETVRRLRRLARDASERRREGAFVAEGPDAVVAALDAGWPLEAVFVAESALTHERLAPVLERTGVIVITDAALERAADAQAPQGVIATCRLPSRTLDEVDPSGLLLVLEGLQDPGNVGTLVRSADAAGASGVVLVGEGVDPFHPKVVRASAGAIFRALTLQCSRDELLAWSSSHGVRSFATVLRGGMDPRQAPLQEPCAVWIGSEARGLSGETLAHLPDRVSIPMASSVESLNAAVAGSLLLFEGLYQRSHSSGGAPPPSL
jgi:TrmH family RNA methyltransferase